MTSADAAAGGAAPVKRPFRRRPSGTAFGGDRSVRPDSGRNDRRAAVAVGYEPRVDLLPLEVRQDRKQRAAVRRAWLAVILVAVLVILASGAAYSASTSAAAEMTAVQGQTVVLLRQEQSYAEVKQVQAQTALIEAGQEVGGATEIDWGTTLSTIQTSLPAGVTITGVQIDSATPLQSFTQATAPLQGARVATVTITAASAELPAIPVWITSLGQVPGFVDANANSVTLSTDEAGGYTTNLTIHLDTDAYDGKYTGKKGE
ncbi:hypothetical protein LQK89_15710 [Curtobacterium sp. C1]|uniref:hypothetical protein n=1 Tax=Curtobacterium sp. C1 TaxID=2898151 RepID=UPI001E51AC6E|nr:hypothetical protein [Curtobacterium sp. C1]UFU13926.1 hypothetical protein LQK89_15710 [Curtobacterium sp. C1]